MTISARVRAVLRRLISSKTDSAGPAGQRGAAKYKKSSTVHKRTELAHGGSHTWIKYTLLPRGQGRPGGGGKNHHEVRA
jgi:hypothetical protein